MQTKPFLKYPGAKTRLIPVIAAALAPGRRLIEPFVGSAAVFLGLGHRYEAAVLADINLDIIALYRGLCNDAGRLIAACEELMTPEANTPDGYYALRARFNAAAPGSHERVVALPVINRLCYNGLIRYNRRGGLNTPLGSYRNPRVPREQMLAFAQAAGQAEISCVSFRTTMAVAGAGDVVYCDPPYLPMSPSANFTAYATGGFSLTDQRDLVEMALAAAARGAHVVISNHDTPLARELYRDADEIRTVEVRRSISCKGDGRATVPELLAIYRPAAAAVNRQHILPVAA